MECCYQNGQFFSLLLFRAVSGSRPVPALLADEALALLDTRLRAPDLVARIAPDVIAALLIETESEGAGRAVDRVARQMCRGAERARS